MAVKGLFQHSYLCCHNICLSQWVQELDKVDLIFAVKTNPDGTKSVNTYSNSRIMESGMDGKMHSREFESKLSLDQPKA